MGDYEAIAEFARNESALWGTNGCYNWVYDDFINRYTFTEWDSPDVFQGRQGLFSRCTDLGWFGGTTSPNDPMGDLVPINYFVESCADIFKQPFDLEQMLLDIDFETNQRFGGRNPNITNAVFTNGAINNWRDAARNEDLNESSPAFRIPNEGVGAELQSISENDSIELREIKEEIQRLIVMWLTE